MPAPTPEAIAAIVAKLKRRLSIENNAAANARSDQRLRAKHTALALQLEEIIAELEIYTPGEGMEGQGE